MKLCVTAQGKTLESAVDPRFGRCQFFMIVDTDTMAFEAVENTCGMSGGAGIQAGQMMADKSVQVVVTGNVGPNAFQTLNAVGIRIITNASGTVAGVIEQFRQGQLTGNTDKPSVDSHFGMSDKPMDGK